MNDWKMCPWGKNKTVLCKRLLPPKYRSVNRMDNSKMRGRQEDGQRLSQSSRYYYYYCNSRKNIELDADIGRHCVDVMVPLCLFSFSRVTLRILKVQPLLGPLSISRMIER